MSNASPDRFVLPDNVKPVHYVLRVEPDLEKETFQGNVLIDLKVSGGNSVSLNSAENLEVSNVFLEQGGSQLKPTNTAVDKEEQIVKYEFEQLQPGDAKISIDFKSPISNQLMGFYLSSYQADGKKKKAVLTNFEPNDCRRAFPCFDEPSLKASYDIIIVCDKELTAISNMNVKEESLEADKKITKFNTTPLMSTYLVAYSVGDYDYAEYSGGRIPSRVYFPKGSAEKSHFEFAAKFSYDTIEFYEKSFKIAYPIPKIDCLAVHDFKVGAMENWGLITYRIALLDYTEGKESTEVKRHVTEVIAHENAHQWFGNLVTMEWWNGLWLNEGFATWVSWYCCNALMPELKVWDSYINDVFSNCMNLDGLRSSHPIEAHIFKARDVADVFDNISYLKGCAVLKMIADYLGEEVFIEGVGSYLKKHKYGNANTSDLWNSLSETSGKELASIMNTWTKKTGYPVITVTEKSDGVVSLKQNRFLATGDVTEEDDKIIYPVYLGIKTKKGVEKFMFDTREAEITVDPDFYLLNSDYASTVRIFYSETRIVKLAEAGSKGLLSVSEKLGLINDSLNLAKSGYTSTTTFLELLSLWRLDKTSGVWKEFFDGASFILGVFKGTEVEGPLKLFLADQVTPIATQLGFEIRDSDSIATVELKAAVFKEGIAFGSKDVVATALKLFDEFTEHGTEIHSSLKYAVFRAVSQHGSPEQWEKLFSIYLSDASSMDSLQIIRILGATPHKELSQKLLDAMLTETIILQNTFFVVIGYASSPFRTLYYDFVKANYDKIVDRLHADPMFLGMALWKGLLYLNTAEELKDVEEFVKTVDFKATKKTFGECIDGLRVKVKVQDRDLKSVAEWLKARGF